MLVQQMKFCQKMEFWYANIRTHSDLNFCAVLDRFGKYGLKLNSLPIISQKENEKQNIRKSHPFWAENFTFCFRNFYFKNFYRSDCGACRR